MKKNLLVLLMVAVLATVSQAVLIDSFVNADFESGIVTTGNGAFAGFDAPAAPEIIGWTNYGNVFDAGVEASGAWWIEGYAYGNCGFVNVGGGASNKSAYVIQDGDQFTASFIGDGWGATSARVSLWYDNPTNVFGSFDTVMDAWFFAPHSNATPIDASQAAVGGILGVTIENLGGNMLGFDEMTVNVVPEPATLVMLGLGAVALLRKRK